MAGLSEGVACAEIASAANDVRTHFDPYLELQVFPRSELRLIHHMQHHLRRFNVVVEPGLHAVCLTAYRECRVAIRWFPTCDRSESGLCEPATFYVGYTKAGNAMHTYDLQRQPETPPRHLLPSRRTHLSICDHASNAMHAGDSRHLRCQPSTHSCLRVSATA